MSFNWGQLDWVWEDDIKRELERSLDTLISHEREEEVFLFERPFTCLNEKTRNILADHF